MRIGRSMFVWCLIEEIQKLSLKIITLDLQTEGAETVKGVRVSITGVCQVKVNAYRIDETGERVLNVNNLGLATQNFLGYDDSEVADMIRKTLEGHQRQILGTLTVEEIYKDRAAFGTSVRTHMTPDLEGMGFELVSYVVASISDSDDYMYSLGQTQTAIVKREAQEGTAKNESEAAKKVSQYTAEAKVSLSLRFKKMVFFSIPLASSCMWSAALDSPDALLSYSLISLASPMTNILIFTLKHTYAFIGCRGYRIKRSLCKQT